VPGCLRGQLRRLPAKDDAAVWQMRSEGHTREADRHAKQASSQWKLRKLPKPCPVQATSASLNRKLCQELTYSLFQSGSVRLSIWDMLTLYLHPGWSGRAWSGRDSGVLVGRRRSRRCQSAPLDDEKQRAAAWRGSIPGTGQMRVVRPSGVSRVSPALAFSVPSPALRRATRGGGLSQRRPRRPGSTVRDLFRLPGAALFVAFHADRFPVLSLLLAFVLGRSEYAHEQP
jgi:hypothetical protein